MTTTPTGVDSEGLSRDETADLLLSRYTDAEKLSNGDEGAKPIRRSETDRSADEDNRSDEDEDDLDFGDDEENEDDKEPKGDGPVDASDEALVTLTVDGDEIKIPVKDLKRLYGQEASLTRKSQEVAQQRKAAEDEGGRYVAATQRLMAKAQERYQPYAQIDWAMAAKTLENDEYIALRTEAKAAHTDLQFLNEEVDQVFADATKSRQEATLEEARVALEILQRDIPNFGAETYQAMATYAVSQGIPEEAMAQLTDATALKLIHKAMAYDQAKERAASKRKAAPTTKRTMTTSRRTESRSGNSDGDAMKRLQASGSRDDAVALLMARSERQDD